jgi:hypothetical protein
MVSGVGRALPLAVGQHPLDEDVVIDDGAVSAAAGEHAIDQVAISGK